MTAKVWSLTRPGLGGTEDTVLWRFLVLTCPIPHSAVGMHWVGWDPGWPGSKTCWDPVLGGPSDGPHNPTFTGETSCCRMPPIPIFTGVEKFILRGWEKKSMGIPTPLVPRRVT